MMPLFIGGCPGSGTRSLARILAAHSRCVPVPHSPERLPGSSLADELVGVARRYAADRDDSRVLVDRNPFDPRLGPALLDACPAAKLVHVVRDGRGVAAAVAGGALGPRTVAHVAPWWVEKLGHGLALESWGGRDRILRVRYEDLVRDTESAIRRICDFAGLEYEGAIARGDLEPGGVDAWRAILTPREIEIFESLTGDLLGYLGYELRFGSHARPASLGERLVAAVVERWPRPLTRRRA